MNPAEPGPNLPPPSTGGPRRGLGVGWLFWLLLLALVAAGGWYGYPWAMEQLNRFRGERDLLARLDSDVAELNQRVRALNRQQLEFGARLQREEQRVDQLSEAIGSGRAGVQLAAIEQLLLMANDQLQLANDARAARLALDEADRRLARIDDPGLLPVREALAQERAALAALPGADRAGSALMLAALIRQAPQWPLRARSPDRFVAATAPDPAATPDGWTQRLWTSLTRALSGMFTVRRNDGSAPRLLPPGEEALVAQSLRLKLEGARLALLAGDGAALREMCGAAGEWLGEYYNDNDPAVAAARRQLNELAQSAATAQRPDISGSLTRLRQLMGRS